MYGWGCNYLGKQALTNFNNGFCRDKHSYAFILRVDRKYPNKNDD